MDDLGQAWVQVDDTELFDFIEDHLIEEYDLEYMWVHTEHETGRPSCHTMTFPGDLMSRIQAALSSLDPKRLHEIYLINNPERSA